MSYATRDQIAHLLNITPRMVNMLVKNEGMPSAGRGQFDSVAVVRWYIEKLREEIKAARRGDETTTQTTNRILRAKAAMAEDRLRKQRAELIPVAQQLQTHQRLVITLKQNLLGLGKEVASRAHGRSQEEIESIINTEVRNHLTELATATVKVMDLRGLGVVHSKSAQSHDAAADPHVKPVGRRTKDHQPRS
jgi:ATP/maltotriose-dependent transcriptional regulator MalT